jgi:hypothetical protein
MKHEFLSQGEQLDAQEETFLFGDPGVEVTGDITILGKKVELALAWLAQHWPVDDIPLVLIESESESLKEAKEINASWLKRGLIEPGSKGLFGEEHIHPILHGLLRERSDFLLESLPRPLYQASMLYVSERSMTDRWYEDKLNYVYALLIEDWDFQRRESQNIFELVRFPNPVAQFGDQPFPSHMVKFD